ncbi:unnamed protein product [Cuscuta campestris]|uniref:CCHC-type domain-containing protein n=1 Tax=Cuscuta campestris TaxID=132261 RepID=A0A484N2L9_9ASTE|nr:unnamed protein product [Cuscuta campestris]
MFRMKEHEKIDDMFDRFSKIVNDLHALKKTYTDRDLVRKILRSLTSEWRSKADAIYESIGTSNVTIDGLRGNLKTYESTILNPSLNDQRKGIALKAFKEPTMNDSSNDDEVKLVMKKFCKLLRKKEKVEDGPVCYGCGEAGHIKNKCPRSGRNARHFKKQRTYISWGGDSGDESSEQEEDEEANLCLIAQEEEESDNGENQELLRMEAYEWWKRIDENPNTPKPWTWEFFDWAFKKEYIPARFREEKRAKFIQLKQGDMTLPEYRQKFVHLAQFAPTLVSTAVDRIEEFCKRLRPDLRPHVSTVGLECRTPVLPELYPQQKGYHDLDNQLQASGIWSFVSRSRQSYNPAFVRAFYSNLRRDGDTIRSSINLYDIEIDLPTFARIAGLPIRGDDIATYGGDDWILKNKAVIIRELGITNLMCHNGAPTIHSAPPDKRLLLYIITRILRPRDSSHTSLFNEDLKAIHAIIHGASINWAKFVMIHMADCTSLATERSLLYAFLVMDIIVASDIHIAGPDTKMTKIWVIQDSTFRKKSGDQDDAGRSRARARAPTCALAPASAWASLQSIADTLNQLTLTVDDMGQYMERMDWTLQRQHHDMTAFFCGINYVPPPFDTTSYEGEDENEDEEDNSYAPSSSPDEADFEDAVDGDPMDVEDDEEDDDADAYTLLLSSLLTIIRYPKTFCQRHFFWLRLDIDVEMSTSLFQMFLEIQPWLNSDVHIPTSLLEDLTPNHGFQLPMPDNAVGHSNIAVGLV